jgi:TolB-like protein
MKPGVILALPRGPADAPDNQIRNAISRESILAQLEKILSSGVFAQSHRLTRFLRLTLERVLQGRGPDLKQYLIGVEVFDRQENYDPRMDPIVRVEAHRLRVKLDEYYRTEGREDPILISLPKGTYAPVFHLREPEVFAGEGIRQTILSPRDLRSIAVLPFADLSQRKGLGFLCCGIADELIRTLTQVEGMRVVSLLLAAKSAGQPYDILEIGRSLEVEVLLGGSVQSAGKKIRVAAQLTRVTDGRHLWSERYDREVGDAFVIQDEVSHAIVEELRANLRVESAAAPPTLRDLKPAS